MEYTLSASWKIWGKASREFSNLPELEQDLQITQLTIQRMIHFIYQLQHYVLFEVSRKINYFQPFLYLYSIVGFRVFMGQT